MKKFITLSLVFSVALPAFAGEPTRPTGRVPERVNGTEKLEQKLIDKKREEYRTGKKLDVATYFQLMQYMEPMENETVRDHQTVVGGAALFVGSTGLFASYFNNGPAKSNTLAGRASHLVTGGTVSQKLLRGASVAAMLFGGYELYNTKFSHEMVKERDQKVRDRVKQFVKTPLERAVRYQLGQEATDELLADWISSGRDPRSMAMAWIEPKDLLWLDEHTEAAKKVYSEILGDKNNGTYIKDADKRDQVAEYYARRRALLEVQLRNESKSDIALYNGLMDTQFKQHVTEIRKDIALWNDELAYRTNPEQFDQATQDSLRRHVEGQPQAVPKHE